MKFKLCLASLLLGLILNGCNSDSGGSNNSTNPGNASINNSNARGLATAATEGAKLAADSDNASQFSFKSAPRAAVESLSESLAKDFALIPVVVPGVCDSGTLTADTLSSTTVLLDYQICNISGVIADGMVTAIVTVDGVITTVILSYLNFSITVGADTTVVNMIANCVVNSSTLSVTCTYSSDVDGIDGRTYSISGLTVSGDNSSGYTVSATITDPDYGVITISTNNPILFNCSNGQPSSGEIEFTDANGVLVTVTFNDCNSFTVFYQGVSTVYNW